MVSLDSLCVFNKNNIVQHEVGLAIVIKVIGSCPIIGCLPITVKSFHIQPFHIFILYSFII